jgi:hypothetical protein
VELDSASLFVHRDSSSFISRWSDSLSKLSIRFEFDRELFVTKVYERWLRSTVKDSLQRRQESLQQGNGKTFTKPRMLAISNEDVENRKRSYAIDRKLEEDSMRLRRENKILVLGTVGSGKEDIIKMMEIHQNGYTTEELKMYRHAVYRNIINCAKDLIEGMTMNGIEPELEANRDYGNFLLHYTLDPDPDAPLEQSVGQAIEALWDDPSIPKVLESWFEFKIGNSAT